MASLKKDKILCVTISTTLSNILHKQYRIGFITVFRKMTIHLFFPDKYLLPTFFGHCLMSCGGLKGEISMFPSLK